MALAPYTPTNFINGQAPAISADNLNKTEQGLANASDAVITLESEMIDVQASTGTYIVAMGQGSAGATIDTTWQDIANYGSVTEIGITGNATTGEILVSTEGYYKFSSTLDLDFADTGNFTGTLSMRLSGDNATTTPELPSGIPKNQTTAAFYPSGLLHLLAGVSYKIQIHSDLTLTTVTYPAAYFELEFKSLIP